jgi:hypothetical protein
MLSQPKGVLAEAYPHADSSSALPILPYYPSPTSSRVRHITFSLLHKSQIHHRSKYSTSINTLAPQPPHETPSLLDLTFGFSFLGTPLESGHVERLKDSLVSGRARQKEERASCLSTRETEMLPGEARGSYEDTTAPAFPACRARYFARSTDTRRVQLNGSGTMALSTTTADVYQRRLDSHFASFRLGTTAL